MNYQNPPQKGIEGCHIPVKDVKEFIRRLKEEVWTVTENCMSGGCDEEQVKESFNYQINKLAGDELK